MSNLLSKVILAAAQAAYTKNGAIVHALPAGYALDGRLGTNGILRDDRTGFQALALYNASTQEVILAFTGTQDGQDWFQNLKLGWDQWQNAQNENDTASNRVKVLTYLAQAQVEGAAKIHFTGHSLGGALAQYAAYDYVAQYRSPEKPNAPLPVPITLTTFNALGGVQGLAQYRDGFNAALFAGVYNRHYWVDGDLVPRLGGGHLGGQTLRLDNLLAAPSRADPGYHPFDPVAGHGLEVVDLLAAAGFRDNAWARPAYLSLKQIQPLAAEIARLFNGLGGAAEAGPTESWARLVAGVMGVITLYTSSPVSIPGSGELDGLINTVLRGWADAHPDDLALSSAVRGLSVLPWEALLGRLPKQVSVGQAGLTGAALAFAALSDVGELTWGQVAPYLPEGLATHLDDAAFRSPFDFWQAFAATMKVTARLAVDALLGRPDEPAVHIGELSVDEGGTGILHLTLSRASDNNGQAVILTVYDTARIELSGPGVLLRDAAAGEYLAIVPPGETKLAIVVSGLEDTDTNTDFSFIRAELTPFSELGGQFKQAPYAIGGITLVDDDVPPPPVFSGTLHGDRAPFDQDPVKDGVQLGYDALGNVIVGPGAAPGREDLLYDSTGNDAIYAHGGDDEIRAFRGGDDRLDGGTGDDIIEAGPGDDFASGGEGRDLVWGGTGSDRLFAEGEIGLEVAILGGETQIGTGSKGDWLDAGAGDDQLVGDAGNDALSGGGGSDLLIGGGGDDHLMGDAEGWAYRNWTIERQVLNTGVITIYKREHLQSGTTVSADGAGDVLFGGAGDDWLHGQLGNDLIDAGTGNDLAFGDEGDDVLFGRDGDDNLSGDELDDDGGGLPGALHGADYLDGGAGNDRIESNGGNDRLLGGDGDDWLMGDDGVTPAQWHGADMLDGGSGNDTLWGFGGIDLMYGGEGDDYLQGDAGSAILAGDWHGADSLDGGAGDDTLIGDGGHDRLFGGNGDDILFGDTPPDQPLADAFHGDDHLDGGGGADKLIGGGGGGDVLYGGDGDDLLRGDGDELSGHLHGSDWLDGGAGDDLLAGDGGDDVLLGGAGDDQLQGDFASLAGEFHGLDHLEGGEGDDLLIGGGSHDTLSGGNGDDILHGDNHPEQPLNAAFHGDDILDGGAGNDRLYGGGGNDTLIGGPGDDYLAGGAGDDLYILDGEGKDVVDDTEGVNQILLPDGSLKDLAVYLNEAGKLTLAPSSNTSLSIGSTNLASVAGISFGGHTLPTDQVLAYKVLRAILCGRSESLVLGIPKDAYCVWPIPGWVKTIGYGYSFGPGAQPLLEVAMGLGTKLGKLDRSTIQSFGFWGPDRPGSWGHPLMTMARPFRQALAFQPNRDPVILDLDGDGLETIGLGANIHFDHDGDGVLTKTGWAGKDDALLVWDRNGNGNIDTGAELFGDFTVLPNGTVAPNGFAALTTLDSNGDGLIDPNDPAFAELKLWIDTDQNGSTGAGELISLADAGIGNLNLSNTLENRRLANGNTLAREGSFTRADGTIGDMGEFRLAQDVFDARFVDAIEVPESIMSLPNLLGAGKVRELWQSAARSGELADLLEQFTATTSRTGQQALVDQLLTVWANTSGMARSLEERTAGKYRIEYEAIGAVRRSSNLTTTSDSGGIHVDATLLSDADNPLLTESYRSLIAEWSRKLHVLEAFNGQYFFNLPEKKSQTDGANWGLSVSPGSGTGIAALPLLRVQFSQTQLDRLDEAYANLRDSIYGALALQTRLKPYLDAIDPAIEAGQLRLDAGPVDRLVNDRFSEDPENALADVLDLDLHVGELLYPANWGGLDNLDTLIEGMPDSPTLLALLDEFRVRRLTSDGDAVALDGTDNRVLAGDGDDNLHGSGGHDRLFGQAGDDALQGDDGHDLLSGGVGNDRLYGGIGGDTYIFGRGFGHDVIFEDSWLAGETDRIRLQSGITPNDVRLTRVREPAGWWETDDLVVTLRDSLETLKISKHFNASNRHAVEQIVFADGTMWGVEEMKSRVLLGEAGNDELRGFNDRDDAIRGGAGNDRLFGLSGDDVLEGGDGDDEIHGGDGDDLIDGGAGNDLLNGGRGSDTFRFGRGDGQDVIVANRGRVLFKPGITPDMVAYSTDGNDLIATVTTSGDAIRIKNWVGHWQRIDRFEYEGGTLHALEDVFALLYAGDDVAVVQGTPYDDHLVGDARHEHIFGHAGNDLLEGGEGDDYLWGGEGDDMLLGGPGTDVLAGDGGRNTYVFNRGDGFDEIRLRAGAVDTLRFGPGIQPEDIRLEKIRLANGDEGLLLKNSEQDVVLITQPAITSITPSVQEVPAIPLGVTVTRDVNKIADALTAGNPTINVVSSQLRAQGGYSGGLTGLHNLGGVYGIAPGIVLSTGYASLHNAGLSVVLDNSTPTWTWTSLTREELLAGLDYDVDMRWHIDISRLDIDFTTTTGSLSFQVVYVSDEYPAYPQFFDSFGLFINGVNIALVNGLPVNASHPAMTPLPGMEFGGMLAPAGDPVLHFSAVGLATGLIHRMTFVVGDSFDATSDTTVYIAGMEGGPSFSLQRFEFSDGRVLSLAEMLALPASEGSDGDDLLEARDNGEPLAGGTGSDTYRIRVEAGSVPTETVIIETWREQDTNRIELTGTVNADEVYLEFDGRDLLLRLTEAGDAIRFAGFDPRAPGMRPPVAEIQFPGRSLSFDELLAQGVRYGGRTHDTYVVKLGDGIVTIDDLAEQDAGNVLRFGPGIDPNALHNNLRFETDGNGGHVLLITYGDDGDVVRLTGFDPHDVLGTHAVERFEFADGTAVDYATLASWTFVVEGDNAGNAQAGTNVGDRLYGYDGDDVMEPGDGEDVLTGGLGNDVLRGGGQRDAYVVNPGDGEDVIEDDLDAGIGNVLTFGEGIAREDVRLQVDGDDLLIHYGSGGDVVRVANYAPDGATGGAVIDTFEFADGTAVTLREFMNRAPEIANPIDVQMVLEDAAFSLVLPDDLFIDADGDDILTRVTVSGYTTLPDWLQYDAATRTLFGTPDNDDVGEFDVIVQGMDTLGASSLHSFHVTVQNTNDAPRPGVPLQDQVGRVGQTLNWRLPEHAFVDLDVGDVLTYSASLSDGGAPPAWLTFDATTGSFSATPAAPGSLSVRVSATDRAGVSASQTFAFEAEGGSRPPITTPDAASVAEDRTLITRGNVLANDHDPEGIPLKVADPGTRRGEYGWLRLLPDGGYAYVLDNASARVQGLAQGQTVTDRFVYTASDGEAHASGELAVTVTGSNDTPVLAKALADVRLARGKDFFWQLPADSFIDPDRTDTLSYTATQVNGRPLPAWLRFDATSQTFSGTAPSNTAAGIDVKVEAGDGHGAGSVAADVFRIRLSNKTVVPKGSAGLGNGEDPPPPGHAFNQNDGPGTRPGQPGDKGKIGNTDDNDLLARFLDGFRADAEAAAAGNGNLAALDAGWFESWLTQPAHPGEAAASTAASRSVEQHWQQLLEALKRLDSDRQGAPQWMDSGQGADISVLAGLLSANAAMLRVQDDALGLAAAGTELKGFAGLREGIQSLAIT